MTRPEVTLGSAVRTKLGIGEVIQFGYTERTKDYILAEFTNGEQAWFAWYDGRWEIW